MSVAGIFKGLFFQKVTLPTLNGGAFPKFFMQYSG